MENWKIYNIFNRDNSIIAGSTTKSSGFSYDFSLAVHTGEELDKIAKNRAKFAAKFPASYGFVSILQVHSNEVIDLSSVDVSNGWYKNSIEADGMVTNQKGAVLTILTADCLAILAYDKVSGVIGAAHAGWRGTKGNIAKELIDKMASLGANIKDIVVALSPSIKGCCYEVGEDVANEFKEYKSALQQTSVDKWHLDISVINKEQLLSIGLEEKNIEVSNICTSCQSKEYFSYRKECGCSGRFMNLLLFVGS